MERKIENCKWKWRYVIPGIIDQLPFTRLFKNLFITKSATGLLHINSHISSYSNNEKVGYNTKKSAIKASIAMKNKNPQFVYSSYRCFYCGKFHIGRNKKRAL